MYAGWPAASRLQYNPPAAGDSTASNQSWNSPCVQSAPVNSSVTSSSTVNAGSSALVSVARDKAATTLHHHANSSQLLQQMTSLQVQKQQTSTAFIKLHHEVLLSSSCKPARSIATLLQLHYLQKHWPVCCENAHHDQPHQGNPGHARQLLAAQQASASKTAVKSSSAAKRRQSSLPATLTGYYCDEAGGRCCAKATTDCPTCSTAVTGNHASCYYLLS